MRKRTRLIIERFCHNIVIKLIKKSLKMITLISGKEGEEYNGTDKNERNIIQNLKKSYPTLSSMVLLRQSSVSRSIALFSSLSFSCCSLKASIVVVWWGDLLVEIERDYTNVNLNF